jgi:RNA polymerase sigma factor (sigma-70 family)
MHANTNAVVNPEQRERAGRLASRQDHDVASLVAAAASGEQRAWSLLVLRFGGMIRSIARRHRLGDADQDEVAQRTWLRLLEHIGSIREPAALGGWLATTTRHECLRVLRSSCREIPVNEPVALDEPDLNTVEDAAVAAERRAALHRALDALPDRQQSLMRMLLAEPALSFDELSVALGIPRGSLGPTHGRCLKLLRQNSALARVVAVAA